MKINLDSKWFRAMTKAWDCFELSFLWFICSLPVITIGTSNTAVLSVMMNVEPEISGTARKFFRAFKKNFLFSTLIWLLLIVLGLMLVADIYLCWSGKIPEKLELFFRFTTVIAVAVYIITLSTVFGIIAKFNVTFGQLFYNVLIIFLHHTKDVFVLAIISVLIVVSVVCLLALSILPLALLFYLQARVIGKILQNYLSVNAASDRGMKQPDE